MFNNKEKKEEEEGTEMGPMKPIKTVPFDEILSILNECITAYTKGYDVPMCCTDKDKNMILEAAQIISDNYEYNVNIGLVQIAALFYYYHVYLIEPMMDIPYVNDNGETIHGDDICPLSKILPDKQVQIVKRIVNTLTISDEEWASEVRRMMMHMRGGKRRERKTKRKRRRKVRRSKGKRK